MFQKPDDVEFVKHGVFGDVEAFVPCVFYDWPGIAVELFEFLRCGVKYLGVDVEQLADAERCLVRPGSGGGDGPHADLIYEIQILQGGLKNLPYVLLIMLCLNYK